MGLERAPRAAGCPGLPPKVPVDSGLTARSRSASTTRRPSPCPSPSASTSLRPFPFPSRSRLRPSRPCTPSRSIPFPSNPIHRTRSCRSHVRAARRRIRRDRRRSLVRAVLIGGAAPARDGEGRSDGEREEQILHGGSPSIHMRITSYTNTYTPARRCLRCNGGCRPARPSPVAARGRGNCPQGPLAPRRPLDRPSRSATVAVTAPALARSRPRIERLSGDPRTRAGPWGESASAEIERARTFRHSPRE